MRLFPGIGVWINQTLNAESENDTNSSPAKEKKLYSDIAEVDKQAALWHEAEKKKPWYDAPPKVKVTKKKGLYHMKIEFTVGLYPHNTYHHLTNEGRLLDYDRFRPVMETKPLKILKEDGPRTITKVKKVVPWDILWWSIPIPIYITADENRKDLTTKYTKDKVMFLKVFEGDYKVEPLYVDAERLCKHKLPKSREEYNICSNGKGKIASKVTMNQYVKPYPLLNVPPFSWYICYITIKKTKTALIALQNRGTMIRRPAPLSYNDKTSSNKQD